MSTDFDGQEYQDFTPIEEVMLHQAEVLRDLMGVLQWRTGPACHLVNVWQAGGVVPLAIEPRRV